MDEVLRKMASIQGDCEMEVGGEFVRVKELGNQNDCMSSSTAQDEFEFEFYSFHSSFHSLKRFKH